MLELERDPEFRVEDYHELTKTQIRERMMKRVCVLYNSKCLIGSTLIG